VISNLKAPAIKKCLATSNEILHVLKTHLEQAMNRIKQQVDLKIIDHEFKVGDWVFIRLQPYKYNTLKNLKNHKIAPNFYVPYQIQTRLDQVSYALDIPNKGRLHDVFYVSCLKKILGPSTLVQIELPLLDEEGKLVLKPECILEVQSLGLLFIDERDLINCKLSKLPRMVPTLGSKC